MNDEGTQVNKNIVIDSTLNADGNIHIGDVINFQLVPKEIVFSNQDVKHPNPYIHRSFLKLSSDEQGDLWNQFFCKDIGQELEKHSHIILLGDAGFGKSTELRRIQIDLIKGGTYRIAFYELKTLESKETSLPYFKVSDIDQKEINNRVILLDGLDEVNFEKALKVISLLKDENPQLKMIVTCRSVVYNNALSGFELYHIQRLNDYELDQFLTQVIPEEKNKFLNNVPSPEIKELLRIPFYLEKTISYYIANQNSLPKNKIDLLQHFINESLKVRIDDKSNINKKDALRKKCYKDLERVAFLLECLGKNSLSEAEFRSLLSEANEEIDLVFNKASIIHFRNNQFQFAHRIIQEYLAAKVLAKANNLKEIKEVIAVKPGFKKIKITWVNSLSDLWTLLKEDSTLKTDYFNWLLKDNPEIFVRFEREKFNPDERLKIFKIIYQEYQKNEINFDLNLFYPSELASFCQSYTSLEYLFQELKKTNKLFEKSNILALLRDFDVQFLSNELKDLVRRELFDQIYDFKKNDSYIRYLAIDTLLHFYSDLSWTEVYKIVDTFFNSSNANERLSSYKAIWKTNNQGKFIELMLKRLPQLNDDNWRGKDNLVDEDYHLGHCFENLDTEDEIVAYFENYPKIFSARSGYHTKDYFREMLQKSLTRHISQGGHDRIFQSVKETLIENICYSFKGIGQICVDYIEKSQKTKDVIKFCLQNPQHHYQNVVAFFISTHKDFYFLDGFKYEDVDPHWMKILFGHISIYSEELMNNFVDALNALTGLHFEKIKNPKHDLVLDEKQKHEREKELYFSRESYLELVADIFDFHGKEKLDKGEVFYKGHSYEESEKFHQRFPNAILFYINNLSYLSKSEILQKISDNWEWESINQLKFFLERNKKFSLSRKEIQIVLDWCDRHSNKLNLDEKVTYRDVAFAWYTLSYNFIHYENHIYIDMIGVGLQNHLGSDLDLVKFAVEKKKIPFSLVKAKIIKTLKDQKIKGFELSKHLEYAKEYKIADALPLFQKYIENLEEGSSIRSKALEGFIECDGNEEYIWNLLETLPSSDDLENELIAFCLMKNPEKAEKILLNKFKMEEEQVKKLTYANFLFQLSNFDSLKFIIKYVEEYKKSPFLFDFREDTLKFNNIKGMKYLLKLYDIGCSPERSQDEIDTIPREVQSLIYHLALSNEGEQFFQVQKRINSFIYWNVLINRLPKPIRRFFRKPQENTIHSLKYLSRDLSYRYYQSQHLSLDEAINLYRKLT